jgi:hypothetical protein
MNGKSRKKTRHKASRHNYNQTIINYRKTMKNKQKLIKNPLQRRSKRNPQRLNPKRQGKGKEHSTSRTTSKLKPKTPNPKTGQNKNNNRKQTGRTTATSPHSSVKNSPTPSKKNETPTKNSFPT